jgi:hypothetical protein
MSRQPLASATEPVSTASNSSINTSNKSPEGMLLDQVSRVLQEDRADEALQLLNESRSHSQAVANARAVCLLRLGRPKEALELLRPLVVSSVALRTDAPLTLKIIFATALLLDGNISACESTLGDIRDEANPDVQQLRAALAKWRGGLSLWQRVWFLTGGEAPTPVKLDFPPGVL